MALLKGSKLYSILHLKCPFCHEGEFFLSHPYDLKHAGDLHEACPICHRKYEKEPGFYYGAMFVSYAIGIAFSLACFGITWWIAPHLSIWGFMIVVVGLMVLAAPYLYALSKIMWANMFFSYQGAGKGTTP
jgi:uncharacterized protein (DUF983 family)